MPLRWLSRLKIKIPGSTSYARRQLFMTKFSDVIMSFFISDAVFVQFSLCGY